MPTIPTGQLERELRALYLRWVMGLSVDSAHMDVKIKSFQSQSEALIARLGGRVAALGALGDFPAPKLLELSPFAGKIYDEMQLATIQAGMLTGLSSKEAAQAMFRAGMDKSYRKLERLARTETTNAYWQNAFNSIADLPALVMVWGSEDGPRTCPWCRERDGMVIDGSGVRDHPNGRCTPIPTLRSQVDYKGSVSQDGSIFWDEAWGNAQPASVAAPVTTEPDFSQLSGQDNLPNLKAIATEAEAEAAEFYTLSGYTRMNDALRGLRTDPDIMVQAAQLKGALDRASLAEDAVLWRRTGADAFGLKNPSQAKTLVGKTFREDGFMSTSYGEGVTGNRLLNREDPGRIAMRVHAPAGTKGADLKGITRFATEDEFLITPGTEFKVIGHEVVEDAWGDKINYIDVTIVKQGG